MKNQLLRRIWIFICTFLVFSLLSSVLLIANPSYAVSIYKRLSVQDVPNPRLEYGGWVTDMVDMLSPSAEKHLNEIISDLEKKNGTEIAVVTVPTTQPAYTPKVFTTNLFKTWGIGKREKDNGVLFLVSQGDRRTEIETGYGIERFLPNSQAVNIIQTKVTPEFKQGNFENGIVAGTEALIQELATVKSYYSTANNQNQDFFLGMVIILVFIGTAVIGSLSAYSNIRKTGNMSSSGYENTGFSSSEGSSFGGGDSGGGGGGDSW